MKNINPILIHHQASVIEALKKINDCNPSLTLFVNDENMQMMGTITDGDIRRGLINGLSLNDDISKFMSTNFHYLTENYTVREVKNIRNKHIRLLPILNAKKQIIKVYDLSRKFNILPLDCMIMAGGRGERLRPLTDNIPKPILPLGRKSIIEHNLDHLISYGIENIYISLKYLGQKIVDKLGNGENLGIHINYVWEETPLGTAGALSLVNKIDSEYILLMNGDLFTDIDLEDLYMNIIEQGADMGIASIPYTIKVPYAIFEEKNNQINGFKEKPTITNHANAGIYIFKKELIKKIPKNTCFNITDLLDIIIKEKLKVIHNPIIGYWIDIGQPEDYLNAQEIIKHLPNGNN